MPTFAQVGLLKRLTGLIYFPVTPLFPHFGLLGVTYLPAKFRLRFLPPVRTDRLEPATLDDRGERDDQHDGEVSEDGAPQPPDSPRPPSDVRASGRPPGSHCFAPISAYIFV